MIANPLDLVVGKLQWKVEITDIPILSQYLKQRQEGTHYHGHLYIYTRKKVDIVHCCWILNHKGQNYTVLKEIICQTNFKSNDVVTFERNFSRLNKSHPTKNMFKFRSKKQHFLRSSPTTQSLSSRVSLEALNLS